MTYLNLSNIKDFNRISNLISNTYEAQTTLNDEETAHITRQVKHMRSNFDSYKIKLKSKPFGRFLGDSSNGAEKNQISNFDIPYHKILETKPLLE